MEGGSSFHAALKLLQDIKQARAQLECELGQEMHELVQRYNRQIKQARRHEKWGAWMVKQTDATFQEVFSQVSLADSIKLLPWCISSTVPLCYMSALECSLLPCNRTRTSQLPQLHLSLRAHLPQAPHAVQLIHSELHLFQYLLYQISPL